MVATVSSGFQYSSAHLFSSGFPFRILPTDNLRQVASRMVRCVRCTCTHGANIEHVAVVNRANEKRDDKVRHFYLARIHGTLVNSGRRHITQHARAQSVGVLSDLDLGVPRCLDDPLVLKESTRILSQFSLGCGDSHTIHYVCLA